ncbi:MAG: hypothetical protein K2X87_29860 [Gemmataceae bacterium]|nr:hypothetical protein [Gemmataceae bacterium]
MTAGGPQPYEVSQSGRVSDRLRELAAEARARGDGPAFVAAVREFFRRLRIYPQFGDPLADLKQERGQLRIGVVSPLVMRYGVLEDRRRVFVSVLPVLMPKSTHPG